MLSSVEGQVHRYTCGSACVYVYVHMPVYTYLYIFTLMICVYEIEKFCLSSKII